MKHFKPVLPFLFVFLLFSGFSGCKTRSLNNSSDEFNAGETKQPSIIWYDEPAEKWLEALPVGNGRLGAMIFGLPGKERIQLNEDSMWPGENGWGLAKGKPQDLQAVRDLLLAGRNKEADALFVDKFLTKDILRSHQTLGDLWIDFGKRDFSNYRRQLNLDSAIARTAYTDAEGNRVQQRVLASYPDDVLVIEYSTKNPEGLTASLSLSRPKDAGHVTANSFVENKALVMQGEITQYNGKFKGKNDPIRSGVQFDTRIKVNAKGGEISYTENTIELKGASSFTVFLVANSSFYHDDYIARSAAQLEQVSKKSMPAILDAHVQDYQALYQRMQLDIDHRAPELPTDRRLQQIKEGASDIGLEELLFEYGRYLLIASSRKGSLPANLQGIWNNDIEAPWNADYHLNINLQMNYWLANVTNLDDLNESLFDYISRLVENGRISAEQNYGCEGSFLPHATDIWATSFLRSRTAFWGASFGAGGWIMQHYWNHYRFTQDKEFLKNRAFPAMQEVAKFYSDWIIEDPRSGKLVSAPSSSPENRFINDNGDTVATCLGSAKDQQVIHELFSNYLEAAKILGIHNEWTNKIAKQLPQLRSGVQLGSDGRLLEWDKEYKEFEPGHRHMSHLYAFHPGNQITEHETPQLVKAVRKSMNYRMEHGGGQTGWSRAWLINLQARLLEGDIAHENILVLLRKSTGPNLFNQHPPFQIDGNFGYTAGVAEMLIQSHEKGLIRILPALPGVWKSGTASGLKARGNITVDIQWENNKARKIRLQSPIEQGFLLKANGQEKHIELKAGEALQLNGELIEI